MKSLILLVLQNLQNLESKQIMNLVKMPGFKFFRKTITLTVCFSAVLLSLHTSRAILAKS